MRFLLGVLLGAALVLVVADGLSAQDWRQRAGAAAEHALTMLRELASPAAKRASTGIDVARAPVAPGPAAPDPEDREPAALERAAAEPVAAESAVAEPAAQPVPRLPEPLLPEPPPEPSRSPVGAAPGLAQPASQSAPQPVWVPFHSRLSARGFADRLSASLDHPFRVERQGPGRYQVVFSYADEPQRQALLAGAAQATGLPL